MSLREGLKIAQKQKFRKIWSITLAHKHHKKSWYHLKIFNIECKSFTIFCNISSFLDKIQQEIISKVCDVFIFYHIVVDKLDFKNSIWWLIQTRTVSYDMSTVDLTANISLWEKVLTAYNNCIRIKDSLVHR